jgi:DNA-binding MarR family transcriptional regulator
MTLNLLPQAGDGLAMGELARALNLRPATVAKTVDSLEARSLVTRIRNQADKRSLVVRVTPDGMALQNAAHSHFQAQIASLFRAMSPADREGLVAGLEALVEAAATQAPTLGHPPIPVAHGAVPAKRSVRQVQPK